MRLFLLSAVTLLLSAACTPSAPPPTTESEEAGESAPAEAPSNRGTVDLELGQTRISIDYGRPRLAGRDMISQLQDGQVWRLGMNEATKLETGSDLQFGETSIPAGAYSLWAKKVSADDWRLIFNSEADIYGTDRKAENDVAETPLESSEVPESVEQFTIELNALGENEAEILMSWGGLQLRRTFTIAQ